MRITLERDTCETILPACEQCFGNFLLHGCVPDRACITDVVEDGKEEVTLKVKYGGIEETLVVTDENRELIAYEGWSNFVEHKPEFKHNIHK